MQKEIDALKAQLRRANTFMYRFMKLFSAFICMLPHSWQYALGTLLGEIAWLAVPPKRKRLAIGQILFCKITDDPVEAKRIARRVRLDLVV